MLTKEEKQKENAELRNKIMVNVKKYRKKERLTQEKLAEKSNISTDFMKRIESNPDENGFSIYTLYNIAVALDVSIDDLMDRDVSKDKKKN